MTLADGLGGEEEVVWSKSGVEGTVGWHGEDGAKRGEEVRESEKVEIRDRLQIYERQTPITSHALSRNWIE